MKYLKAYKLFEASGPVDPSKFSWTKDLTIPRDMQLEIYDMSYELRDEGYTISYQWWPPYEQGNKLYKNSKYGKITFIVYQNIYHGYIFRFFIYIN